MIKPWPCIRSHSGQSFSIFSIRTDTSISPRTGIQHDFYIIEMNDWINIIPLTTDHQVVMVRQYRHGSREVTLEIPAGFIDPGDTPQRAAERELLEETGYQAEEYFEIGVLSPNPAFFSNRCYTFIARHIEKVGVPMLDQTEDIEVVLFPIADVPKLIAGRKIINPIVVTAFYWYFLQGH